MKKGDRFQHQFQVTRAVHAGFMELTGDKNPLHTDESFARAKGFNSVVMHGNILCGFLSYFVGECLPVKNVMLLSEEIMFSKPVYPDDSLMFEAEVADVHESVNAIEFNFRFEKENSQRVAWGTLKIKVLP